MILIAVISLEHRGGRSGFPHAASKKFEVYEISSHRTRCRKSFFPGRTVEVAVIRVAPDLRVLA